ncbi:LysR substrate-binding domain-containing protein [Nocardia sp. NPDC046763]|uniref:LysR substrate-binding domain-containing protein n=1 Tax=Nocardia sp. NPDC046763 TaxID=3155256 RepID=UPI00340EEB4F
MDDIQVRSSPLLERWTTDEQRALHQTVKYKSPRGQTAEFADGGDPWSRTAAGDHRPSPPCSRRTRWSCTRSAGTTRRQAWRTARPTWRLCGCRCPTTAASAGSCCVAVPRQHRLAASDTVTFADLIDEPFLALPESAGQLREYWLALDARGGRPPRIGAVIGSPDEAAHVSSVTL